MDAGLHTVDLGIMPMDEREILRYAQLPKNAGVPETLPLKECIALAAGRVRCRAVWRRYPLTRTECGLHLGFAQTDSLSLQERLEGCTDILLFACTASAEMDRLITRGSLKSPVHGLLMHAIGAQQVESACDCLCKQLARLFPESALIQRYSPGYGDLPLAMQKDIFSALDCERRIGVTLTDSLLMRPSKSVTAIVGMKPLPSNETEPEESTMPDKRVEMIQEARK